MASFNRVILMGNLTRDPQLKYLPNNMAVCEFGLAVNRRFKDRNGSQRDETCFVDISAFGRQGETINQYMNKGSSILVEGRLKFDNWQAQDGSKRSKLSVVAENFTFTGGPRGGGQGGQGGNQGGGYGQQQQSQQPAPQSNDFGNDYSGGYDSGAGETMPPSGDDIPF